MKQTNGDLESQIRNQSHPLLQILELVRVLRGPKGCPWDQDQTLKSMTPYLQEETFEVVEAIGSGDPESFQEELGDLIFLVLFLSEAGQEAGLGGLPEVSQSVVEKLIRRHPHVFQDTPELGSQGALRQWEELKQEEKTTETERSSSLGHRPKGLPALTTAFRISEKAGAVGFEWPTTMEAINKIEEELSELKHELANCPPQETSTQKIENELGDLLYSVANVARYLRIDPERALRATIKKFTARFRYVEQELWKQEKTPSSSTLQEMDALWQESKAKID